MMKYLYKTTLLLLLIPAIVFGHSDIEKPKHEKKKTVSKTFSVNSDAKLSVDNKYGNLNVTTWNKNEIEIEVVITVKGDDLGNVQDRLDDIEIEFEASKSNVSAETTFGGGGNNWSWWKRNNRKNISQKINYTIKMPKTNNVKLSNDYGNIYLDELMGKAEIDSDYGKIELGKLNADNNAINLDYASTSTIEFMKSGSINADYSKLNIEKSENLSVNIDYTQIKLDETEIVDFNSDYGGVTINNAISVKGNSDYTSIRLGTIKKNITLDTDYGAIIVKKLVPGFESVDIKTQYTSVRIGVDPKVSFSFEVSMQYSGFKSDLDDIEYFKKIVESTKKYYEGQYGNDSNAGRIKIKSQYGGVSINEY